MSAEIRYRMTVDCDCLSCDIAATINKRFPAGFTAEEGVEIMMRLAGSTSAMAFVCTGANGLTLGEMPEALARPYVREWGPVQ